MSTIGTDLFAALFGLPQPPDAPVNPERGFEFQALEARPLVGGNQAVSPRQRKMVLRELMGTAEQPAFGNKFLVFDYTPEELTDSKQVDYEDEGDKVCITRPEFKTSKGRVMSFSAFFNDWGKGEQNRVNGDMSVEEKIALLRVWQCPSPSSIAGAGAPPVLALVWREFFRCVLTGAEVTRQKLHPQSHNAIRATVSIELKEWIVEPK